MTSIIRFYEKPKLLSLIKNFYKLLISIYNESAPHVNGNRIQQRFKEAHSRETNFPDIVWSLSRFPCCVLLALSWNIYFICWLPYSTYLYLDFHLFWGVVLCSRSSLKEGQYEAQDSSHMYNTSSEILPSSFFYK